MRLLTLALLCGCGIDPFETPSAYDQQKYLCGDPKHLAQLQDAADACLTNPAPGAAPCEGYISFQGSIQRVQLRVDTTLERGSVRVVTEKETDPKDTGKDTGPEIVEYLSRVEMSGAAPYFHFDVAVSSIGTPWHDEPTDKNDELAFQEPDPDTALVLDDPYGAVQWSIRAGSDSAMLSSNQTTDPKKPVGTITVSHVSDDQVDLQFQGSLGPAGDTLDACAIVFPPSIDRVPNQ